MTEVSCYICDKSVEIDTIERHLRSHSDEDYQAALRRVVRNRKKDAGTLKEEPISTSVGTVVRKKDPEFVQLDENNQNVIESTNGT